MEVKGRFSEFDLRLSKNRLAGQGDSRFGTSCPIKSESQLQMCAGLCGVARWFDHSTQVIVQLEGCPLLENRLLGRHDNLIGDSLEYILHKEVNLKQQQAIRN